jgi:hypothetical protein
MSSNDPAISKYVIIFSPYFDQWKPIIPSYGLNLRMDQWKIAETVYLLSDFVCFNLPPKFGCFPCESFPICQKNGLKFFPIRHEFSQNGSSLDSRACKHRVSISCVIILIPWKRFCEPDESPWCLMCVYFLMSCKTQIRHAHFFHFFPLYSMFPFH